MSTPSFFVVNDLLYVVPNEQITTNVDVKIPFGSSDSTHWVSLQYITGWLQGGGDRQYNVSISYTPVNVRPLRQPTYIPGVLTGKVDYQNHYLPHSCYCQKPLLKTMYFYHNVRKWLEPSL